jgi:hypothetical protein
VVCVVALALAGPVAAKDVITVVREARDVEGWQVQVDTRLLKGPDAELGEKALRTLAFKLMQIKILLPKSRLAKLQKVGIVLDHSYPGLKPMQYHANVGWLKEHGHDPKLAKCVHLPQAVDLTNRHLVDQQPMAILHELAHAYHDQVLDFEEPRVKAAWVRFKESGKFDKVLHIAGSTRPHYALKNQMEFFAEMTEAFFGTNDFYPFVRGELKKELPELDKLLEEIWLKD